MRRALIMLVLVVVAVFVLGGTANAARGQVLHFRYHGTVVSALWTTATTNASTDTYILAANEKRGPELRVNQTTFFLDDRPWVGSSKSKSSPTYRDGPDDGERGLWCADGASFLGS